MNLLGDIATNTITNKDITNHNEWTEPIPTLDELLIKLAFRLSMNGYGFTINKRLKQIRWDKGYQTNCPKCKGRGKIIQ